MALRDTHFRCQFEVAHPPIKEGMLAEYAQWAIENDLMFGNYWETDRGWIIHIEGKEHLVLQWISKFYDTGQEPEEILEDATMCSYQR